MGAVSIWGIVLYSGFFPCIASALLVITPKFMREHAHRGLEAIFFFDFYGRFWPIINFFLVTEFFILSYLIREAWTTSLQHVDLMRNGSAQCTQRAFNGADSETVMRPPGRSLRGGMSVHYCDLQTQIVLSIELLSMLYALLHYERQMTALRAEKAALQRAKGAGEQKKTK